MFEEIRIKLAEKRLLALRKANDDKRELARLQEEIKQEQQTARQLDNESRNIRKSQHSRTEREETDRIAKRILSPKQP